MYNHMTLKIYSLLDKAKLINYFPYNININCNGFCHLQHFKNQNENKQRKLIIFYVFSIMGNV